MRSRPSCRRRSASTNGTGPARSAGLALLLLSLLPACAATGTAVAERELDVQTRMSDTIFLDPGPPGARTLFLEVKNTSDKPELDIERRVGRLLAAKGYTLTDDPAEARYLLQANVLQAGRSARTAAELAYRKGFGSPVSGAIVGGAAGYGAGYAGADDTLAVLGGALLGAAAATLADSYVQRVDYALITDVQISERAPSGVIVTETERIDLPAGAGGARTQTSSRTAAWKRYRTRIVSTAEQVNLDWPDAAPALVAGLSRSIAGIF